MAEDSNTPNDPNSNNDNKQKSDSASKSSQVDLALELNNVLGLTADILESINRQVQNQASMTVSMLESFQKMNQSMLKISNSVDTISKSLSSAAEDFLAQIAGNDIEEINKNLEDVSDTVSKGATANSQNMTDLSEGMLAVAESHAGVAEGIANNTQGVSDNALHTSSNIQKLRKNIKRLSVVVKDWFEKALMPFTVSLSDLVDAIPSSIKSIVRGGWAIAKGLLNSITSLVGAATQLLKFSITLPFTIAKAAANIGNTLRTEYVEVIQQAGEDLKEHFDFDSHIGEGIQKMTQRGKGMLIAFQSPSSELVKLFGMGSAGIANMIKEVGDNVNAMGHFSEIFGRSIMGNAKRTKNFTKMIRAFGFSSEDISYMALDASTKLEHVNTRMAKMGVVLSSVATEYGVDRKRLSKNFMILRKDIIQFGHLSDEEIAKTTANLTQMRVKLEDAAAVFKKFSTFEDAANSVAILSQTFGMNLDAFDMIQAKNPEEIIGMFRNSMLETGRSFKDLNRFEKDLMAQHTGMSAESLAALMNYRDLGLTHEEAVKKMESEKPEAKQMASLKKLNSAIKEVQKVMSFESPFRAFGEGLSANATLGGELQNVLVSLSKGYEGIYEYARTLDPKTWSGLVTPINHIIKIMRTIFKSKAFKKALVNTVEIMAHFVGKLFNFDDVAKKANKQQSDLASAGEDLAEGLNSVASKNAENVGNLVSLSGRIMGSILKGAAIGFTALFKVTNDGIKTLSEHMSKRDPNKNLIESFFGWDPGDVAQMSAGLKRAILDFFNNTSGMVSLTTWLLEGFTDIFGIIAGIFGNTLLSGLDEIFGTKFAQRPSNVLNKTALKARRATSTDTSSSIGASLAKNEDVDKTDLASMIHDLGDKIGTVTDPTQKAKLEGYLGTLKEKFVHDDTSSNDYNDMALQTAALMYGINDGKYTGNMGRATTASRYHTGMMSGTEALAYMGTGAAVGGALLGPVGAAGGAFIQGTAAVVKDLITSDVSNLIKTASEFDDLMSEKTKPHIDIEDSNFMHVGGRFREDLHRDMKFQAFWANHGNEIVGALNASSSYRNHKDVLIPQDQLPGTNFHKDPYYNTFASKLGYPQPPSAPPAEMTVASQNKNRSAKDLSLLSKLAGLSSWGHVLNNLMHSVDIPYKADDNHAVPVIDNAYDDISRLSLEGRRTLSKAKVEETTQNLLTCKDKIKDQEVEVCPEVLIGPSVIDKFMKTMAKSNLVRILGMPEYTNGVMCLIESAIGSRCFNVTSDGTSASTEIIHPG